MENNKIEIIFQTEKTVIPINIQQPDLAGLVHKIVAEHLNVSKENVKIKTENKSFDTEEFLGLLIDVHEEFCEEIEKFYKNIDTEISTYYEDEKLSEYIINEIKNLYSEEVNGKMRG